jgi:hypothetical protein
MGRQVIAFAIGPFLHNHEWLILICCLGLGLYLLFRAQTPVGTAMRFAPDSGKPLGERYYIESLPLDKVRTHSCSFVEFDGRGDYIDFSQHTHAWHTVRDLARSGRLLLVIYCHGWKNNSQSSDVVRFVDFLGRLASSDAVSGYRVHGIFLGWQGNLYWPHFEKTDAFDRTTKNFGDSVVNPQWNRRFTWTAWVQENLSYWSRRNAAENKVSSVAMARTVYTCASLVKAIARDHGDQPRDPLASRVMVMGHSFGALMLERAISATCLDPLTKEWTWFAKSDSQPAGPPPNPNPLPLDFVFFVNSAAPSIYAKLMRDFLVAHESALVKGNADPAYAPTFVSLTSSADWATGFAHPAANIFCRFYPSLQRVYTQLLKLSTPCRVNQSWFYRRTPGHQPLLVDHWLKRRGPEDVEMDVTQVLERNLDYRTTQPLEFWAHLSGSGKRPLDSWELTRSPAPVDVRWANKFGLLVPSRSSYWIIRCDKDVIRDHNDIWSDTALEVYAALYRFVLWAQVDSQSNQVLQAYWK